MLAMTGYFSWVLAIPIYIIDHLKYSPSDLGLGMLVVSSASIFLGGLSNAMLSYRLSIDTILVSAWCFLLMTSIAPLLLFYWYGFQALWLYIMMGMYFAQQCCGLIST